MTTAIWTLCIVAASVVVRVAVNAVREYLSRTWCEGYELGWQNSRAQMESDAKLARIQAGRRAVEAQLVERERGAVN
jgi:hypothetical protein